MVFRSVLSDVHVVVRFHKLESTHPISQHLLSNSLSPCTLSLSFISSVQWDL